MSSLVTRSNALAPSTGGTGAAPAAPKGTGAAGVATLSIVRMTALLDQARKALGILQDVGKELLQEVSVTGDLAEHLTASFGERTSLAELQTIAALLNQIVEDSLTLVIRGHDAVHGAALANFQVLVAQEQLHRLGADGGWVDSQSHAG